MVRRPREKAGIGGSSTKKKLLEEVNYQNINPYPTNDQLRQQSLAPGPNK